MKSLLYVALLVFSMGFTSCEKENLVKEEKVFLQKDYVPSNPMYGGWSLILRTDGSADITPAGDIIYRGTYKIKGKSIKVETDQTGNFEFKIISDTEIKEEKYGTVLILK